MVLNNRWYRNSDGRGITKWLGPQMAIYTHMYAYIRIYTHIYAYIRIYTNMHMQNVPSLEHPHMEISHETPPHGRPLIV